jgi:hypothetical protein
VIDELTVSFRSFVGVEDIEKALLSSYARSLSDKHLHINLEEIEWISPFGVTTLICWLYEVTQKGTARCSLPVVESFAASFLTSIGFQRSIEALGVQVTKRPSRYATLRKGKLAALRSFRTASEYQTYCSELGGEKGQRLLLELNEIPEFISSGFFHRIVLSELLDNCFTHAQGVNCHYAAFEAAATAQARSPHPLFASFGTSGYIEVSVADSAASNVIRTLSPHVPSAYDPTQGFDIRGKLRDDDERTILHAFDYASSSNPGAREDKIRAWLKDYEGQVQEIATGLYENLTLARLYSGQLIIRTGGKLGTIDFSQSSPNARPRASFWNIGRTRRLAALRGTVIAIRVPVTRTLEGKRLAPTTAAQAGVSRTAGATMSMEVLTLSSSVGDPDYAKALVQLEQQLVSTFREGIATPGFVVCSFEQTAMPTKILCAFAELISHIPRFGKGFALLVEQDHFQHLATHWHQLLATKEEKLSIGADPALMLLTGTRAAQGAYGSERRSAATRLLDGDIYSPGGARIAVDALIARIRKELVAKTLVSEPVRHGDGGVVYLIERSYYVNRFYEIRALFDNQSARTHLAYWLAHEFEVQKPDAVIYNVDFLKTLVADALARCSPSLPKPMVFNAATQAPAALAMSIGMLSSERPRVVILCDVLVTARLPKSFLARYAHPTDVSIVTVVDGREGVRDYLTYEDTAAPLQIAVTSILRDQLSPIRDRPKDVRPRDVIIIDPKTHSPTKYPLPEEARASELEILKRLDSDAAVRPGHFELGDKHFPYFAPFRVAFESIHDEIVGWLQQEYADIGTYARSDPAKLHIYCLSEGSNLEHIVAQTFPNISRLKVVTREQLEAPPARSSSEALSVWFIIPALATGTTTQQILDYASSLGPRDIRLSILFARTDPRTVGFYQRITEYGGFKTKVTSMVSVPFPWFSKAHCPVCAARANLENLLSHDAVKTRLALRLLLERAFSEARAEVLTSASAIPLTWERPEDYPLWREIYIVSLYNRSERDLDARVKLQEQLAEETGVELLATGFGRSWTDKLSVSSDAARSIYKTEVLDRACVQWVNKQPADCQLFAFQLRGFHLLAPETLQSLLNQLWLRIAADEECCRQMLIAAAQDPTYYWEAIDVLTGSIDGPYQEALGELKEAIQTKGFGVYEGVVLYTRLYRLLCRTGGWGQPFENLKLGISAGAAESAEVDSLLRIFLQDGFDEASSLFRQLQETPLYWKRISHCNAKLRHRWDALVQSVTDMKNALFTRPIASVTLLNALSNVDAARGSFVAQMEAIGCRPGPVLASMLEATPYNLSKERASLQVDIDDNCRSLAIHEFDFAQIVQEILSNAKKYDTVADLSDVRFRLASTGESLSLVCLEVFQAGPWMTSKKAETGLNMIRELAAAYGALVRFPLRSGSRDEATVQILFHAWPPDDTTPQINVP